MSSLPQATTGVFVALPRGESVFFHILQRFGSEDDTRLAFFHILVTTPSATFLLFALRRTATTEGAGAVNISPYFTEGEDCFIGGRTSFIGNNGSDGGDNIFVQTVLLLLCSSGGASCKSKELYCGIRHVCVEAWQKYVDTKTKNLDVLSPTPEVKQSAR